MHFKSAARSIGVAVLSLTCIQLITGCSDTRHRVDAGRSLTPPPALREFRAAWVATVENIDWPHKPALSSEQQQKEIVEILDRAAELKMNAIILQVRTSCDALYQSKLEPWSNFLTGTQGKAPDPFYDPLKMWVEEAHKRGIELHAWFNPFRAGMPNRGELSSDHVSKTHPDWVKTYGKYLWLDPGQPAAREHTLAVFMDVVKRYDIDGVHMDDYFYPYPDKAAGDFPDGDAWQKYVESGGQLSRAEWRRDNINSLVKSIYTGIKKIKPHVQFGISPFGIAKPGHPPTVKSGFNQYDELYADAQLWLNKGWCDYLTPQLYWKVDSPQPYKDLLQWWSNENLMGRHLWPGLFTTRIPSEGARRPRRRAEATPPTTAPATQPSSKEWEPDDILEQIAATHDTAGATGHVHFSMIGLMQNRHGINDALKIGPYAEAALVPPSPWLDDQVPPAPSFHATRERGASTVHVTWRLRGKKEPRVWAIHAKYGAAWKLFTIPPQSRETTLAPDPVLGPVLAVSVSAVDRSGNESNVENALMPRETR